MRVERAQIEMIRGERQVHESEARWHPQEVPLIYKSSMSSTARIR